MTIELTPADLALEMDRYKEPLARLREMVHEWGLGTWQLSKFSANWRIGWSHRLSGRAQWSAFRLSWRGAPLIGLLFDSGGDQLACYMAGWVKEVKEYNAELANYWVAFLNKEIADRLTGVVSKYNGRIGLVDDAQDEMYAYEDEVEHRNVTTGKNSYVYERSPKVKALFDEVDRDLAEKRRAGSADEPDNPIEFRRTTSHRPKEQP